MTLDTCLTLALAIALLTLKPGPGMLAIISRSLTDGFKSGFALALGIVTIQVVFFTVAAFGFAMIEQHMLFISILLKSLGAAYLIYLGVKGLLNVESGLWKGPQGGGKTLSLPENYMAGTAITLGNPFVILFYAAIIPSILNLEKLHWNDLVIAASIIAVTNLSLLSLEALLAEKAGTLLKNLTVVRRVNIGVSVLFILIGLFLGLSALPLFNFELGFNLR